VAAGDYAEDDNHGERQQVEADGGESGQREQIAGRLVRFVFFAWHDGLIQSIAFPPFPQKQAERMGHGPS
jgi:hypothetical protein